MRKDEKNGVIEIGHIFFGKKLAKTRGATEAFFLMEDYIFSQNYRRFEWKCDNDNAPSKKQLYGLALHLKAFFANI